MQYIIWIMWRKEEEGEGGWRKKDEGGNEVFT